MVLLNILQKLLFVKQVVNEQIIPPFVKKSDAKPAFADYTNALITIYVGCESFWNFADIAQIFRISKTCPSSY